MLHLQIFTFNVASENTYLLYNDENNAWLFDPGNMNEKETSTLENFISEKNLTITNILLTHAHLDHVFGLQWAFDTYKIPVKMHKEDQEVLDMFPMSASRFGVLVQPIKVETQYISEGDILNFDGEEFKIFHVPGHSPGSIIFYNEKQNFMISGDVLFEGSIGRTDLYKGDYELLIDGIKKKLLPLPGNTQVFSGHGNSTTIEFEKNYNPFLK